MYFTRVRERSNEKVHTDHSEIILYGTLFSQDFLTLFAVDPIYRAQNIFR